jgi:hypothetical protein
MTVNIATATIQSRRGIRPVTLRQPSPWSFVLVKVSPLEVSRCAFEIWGRGLTDERDERVSTVSVGTGSGKAAFTNLRSLQALRGHVTRDLVAELRAKIAEDETTSTKPDSTTSSMPRQKSPSRPRR